MIIAQGACCKMEIHLFATGETGQRGRWLGVSESYFEMHDLTLDVVEDTRRVLSEQRKDMIAGLPDGTALVILMPAHANGFPLMFIARGGILT